MRSVVVSCTNLDASLLWFVRNKTSSLIMMMNLGLLGVRLRGLRLQYAFSLHENVIVTCKNCSKMNKLFKNFKTFISIKISATIPLGLHLPISAMMYSILNLLTIRSRSNWKSFLPLCARLEYLYPTGYFQLGPKTYTKVWSQFSSPPAAINRFEWLHPRCLQPSVKSFASRGHLNCAEYVVVQKGANLWLWSECYNQICTSKLGRDIFF